MTTKDIKLNEDITLVMGFIYLYYVKMHKNIKLDYLLDKLKEQDDSFSTERLNFALKMISKEKLVEFRKCIADENSNGILNWNIKEINPEGINYIEDIKKNKQNKILVNIELVFSK